MYRGHQPFSGARLWFQKHTDCFEDLLEKQWSLIGHEGQWTQWTLSCHVNCSKFISTVSATVLSVLVVWISDSSIFFYPGRKQIPVPCSEKLSHCSIVTSSHGLKESAITTLCLFSSRKFISRLSLPHQFCTNSIYNVLPLIAPIQYIVVLSPIWVYAFVWRFLSLENSVPHSFWILSWCSLSIFPISDFQTVNITLFRHTVCANSLVRQERSWYRIN